MANTTTNSAAAWRPDAFAFAPEDAVDDALVMATSTVSGSVEGDEPAVRVAYVDDADADFIAEGDDIPTAAPALSEVLVYTGKVSQVVRLSNEQWVQDNVGQRISDSVRRAVVRRANEAYISQAAPIAPAVTPPAGLLNIAGITSGGAIADDLDALADAFALVEAAGGEVSHIIAAPTAFGYLRKFKTATGEATSLLGAGTADMDRRLLGVPVLTTSAMPAGGLLVLDRTAVVSAVGPVRVARSEHAFFTADSVALRCTWRFGANVVHPDRIVSMTVTDPDAV